MVAYLKWALGVVFAADVKDSITSLCLQVVDCLIDVAQDAVIVFQGDGLPAK